MLKATHNLRYQNIASYRLSKNKLKRAIHSTGTRTTNTISRNVVGLDVLKMPIYNLVARFFLIHSLPNFWRDSENRIMMLYIVLETIRHYRNRDNSYLTQSRSID